jgi:hypothetical protein
MMGFRCVREAEPKLDTVDARHGPGGARSRVTIAFKRDSGTIVGRWKGKGKRLSIARVSTDGRSLTFENVSSVYSMVGNSTTAWDRVPNS